MKWNKTYLKVKIIWALLVLSSLIIAAGAPGKWT